MEELGPILKPESWMGCEYIEKRRSIQEKGNMGKILELEMNILFMGTVKDTVVLVFCFVLIMKSMR